MVSAVVVHEDHGAGGGAFADGWPAAEPTAAPLTCPSKSTQAYSKTGALTTVPRMDGRAGTAAAQASKEFHR